MDLYKYRWQILFILLGASFLGVGIYLTKAIDFSSHDVEVLGETTDIKSKLIVEISGAVTSPGVYEVDNDARINDVLGKAGGLSETADTAWVEKMINKAAKVSDGQKIYIPSVNEQSDKTSDKQNGLYQTNQAKTSNSSSGLVNINTASLSELESLWGIGPVTAQNIIDQRPYSSVDELVSKNVIKSNVYQRDKELLTVY